MIFSQVLNQVDTHIKKQQLSYSQSFVRSEDQNSKKNEEKMKQGKWDQAQNQKYIQFLRGHTKDFKTSTIRRQQKTFLQMQKVIPTRSAEQCRGHHRKVQKLAGTRNINEIIEFSLKRMQRKNLRRRVFENKILEASINNKELKQKNQELIVPKMLEIKQQKSNTYIIKVNVAKIPIWKI